MKAQKVQFTETVLRDANQSLIATRLPYDKFDGILEEMDKAGYYSIECWGGATFDSCLRFLNEDPWERLRKIRKKVKNTKLQMLLRGQNLLGYRHYPDDVVKMFVKKSVENGIDIIRIFDALNDTRNIKVAVEETVKAGAIASGAISYTTSPVHTLDNFVGVASEMKEMGVSTICIKDMAGVMGPQECYDLVKALKEKVGLPVVLHTHCTTGLAFITYLKGIEAGADVIDTASSAFSGGTSQPATETLVYALRELGYDCVADADVMKKVNDFFKPIRNDYIADGTLMPLAMVTDTDALNYKVPGGMLSNLVFAAQTAERTRQTQSGVGGNSPRERGPRISPAGHAHESDGRRAGDAERAARRTLQKHRQRGQGLSARRIRPRARQGQPRACQKGVGRRKTHRMPFC